MEDNLILAGVISSAYNLQGLVKITSYTSEPKDICTHVCYDKNEKEYKLRFVRQDKQKVVARIEGITDRTMAEKILRTKLYVTREAFPELTESEHYITDLIGLNVMNEKNELIGKVKAFHNFGAGDIIEITHQDKESEMYPFSKELFPEITNEFLKIILPEPGEN